MEWGRMIALDLEMARELEMGWDRDTGSNLQMQLDKDLIGKLNQIWIWDQQLVVSR